MNLNVPAIEKLLDYTASPEISAFAEVEGRRAAREARSSWGQGLRS